MIGVSFEEGKVLFMKICVHCGNAMNDEAKFCVNCGTQANGYSNYTYQSQQNRNFFDNRQMLRQNIGTREMVSGIIWICVGGIQTLISIFAFWYLIFVGIWNIVFGIKRVNKKDKLLYMSNDEIYNDYSSRLSSIIVFLVLNVLFGGIIGIAGAIYDLVVRNYVIQNIQQQKTYIGNGMPSNNQVSYQPMNQSHEYINKHLDETNNTFIAQEEKKPEPVVKKEPRHKFRTYKDTKIVVKEISKENLVLNFSDVKDSKDLMPTYKHKEKPVYDYNLVPEGEAIIIVVEYIMDEQGKIIQAYPVLPAEKSDLGLSEEEYQDLNTACIQALEKYEIIPPKDKRGNIPQQEKFILTHDGAVEKFEF